jgi:hypothetical protein
MGLYPEKCMDVLRSVSLRIEHSDREEQRQPYTPPAKLAEVQSASISEQICNSAAEMGKSSFISSLLKWTLQDTPFFPRAARMTLNRTFSAKKNSLEGSSQ